MPRRSVAVLLTIALTGASVSGLPVDQGHVGRTGRASPHAAHGPAGRYPRGGRTADHEPARRAHEALQSAAGVSRGARPGRGAVPHSTAPPATARRPAGTASWPGTSGACRISTPPTSRTTPTGGSTQSSGKAASTCRRSPSRLTSTSAGPSCTTSGHSPPTRDDDKRRRSHLRSRAAGPAGMRCARHPGVPARRLLRRGDPGVASAIGQRPVLRRAGACRCRRLRAHAGHFGALGPRAEAAGRGHLGVPAARRRPAAGPVPGYFRVGAVGRGTGRGQDPMAERSFLRHAARAGVHRVDGPGARVRLPLAPAGHRNAG